MIVIKEIDNIGYAFFMLRAIAITHDVTECAGIYHNIINQGSLHTPYSRDFPETFRNICIAPQT